MDVMISEQFKMDQEKTVLKVSGCEVMFVHDWRFGPLGRLKQTIWF